MQRKLTLKVAGQTAACFGLDRYCRKLLSHARDSDACDSAGWVFQVLSVASIGAASCMMSGIVKPRFGLLSFFQHQVH